MPFIKTWIEDGEEEQITEEDALYILDGYYKDGEAVMQLLKDNPGEHLARSFDAVYRWEAESNESM